MSRSLYNTRSSKQRGDSGRALSEGSPASIVEIQRAPKRLQKVVSEHQEGASNAQGLGEPGNSSTVEEIAATHPKGSFTSYRPKKSHSRSGSSTTSRTSLSSVARARLEMQIAEINLEKSKRDQTLAKAMAKAKADADQAVIQAETEQAVVQAETDLAKAKVMANAYDGLLDLDEDNPAPSLSAHEKVSNYVASLVEPNEDAGPFNAAQVSGSSSEPGNLLPTDTTPPVQSLNPHAASWVVPPTVVSSPLGISTVEVPPAASSSTAVGFSSPYTHRVSSESNQTPLLDGPALSSGHIVSPLVSGSHSPSPWVLPVSSPVTAGLSSFASTAPVFLGPASSGYAYSPCAQVPGAPVSTSSGCTLVSGSPLPTPRVLPTVSESQPSAPAQRERCNDLKELAQVIVRCQDSRALAQDQQFDGDPLKYHIFIRQIQDRILRLHGQSDPAHALQMLLDSTAGQARRLISNCVMLPAAQGLQEALSLLYKAFGSPSVSIKAHLKLVCEGPLIRSDEKGLREFYADLINCKMVLQSANAANQLDATSTTDGIFSRLPRHYQEQFAKLAMKRGYDMDVVPFNLFVEFIDQAQGLASSRLGRLMAAPRDHDKTQRRSSGGSRSKPARVHAVQSRDIPTSSVPVTPKREDQKVKGDRLCTACGAPGHFVWRCEQFNKKSVAERKTLVKQKRLCFNCLGSGHVVSKCPSKARCRICQQSHHSLLHLPGGTKGDESLSSGSPVSSNGPKADRGSTSENGLKENPETKNAYACGSKARGRLQVLPVRIANPTSGKSKDILALLDTGADVHLLSQQVFDELELKGWPVRSSLQLADGSVKVSNTVDTECTVRGINEMEVFSLTGVRVVDGLPDCSASIPSGRDFACNEHLADVDIPLIGTDRVDLLLGTCSPALHVFSEVRQGDDSNLWAGKSPLGWVLFGCDPEPLGTDHVNLISSRDVERVSEALCPCQLDFVDLSHDPDELLPSEDDKTATDLMQSSCTWKDGHYSMRLPWRKGCPNLPDNYPVALSRLKSLGRRLLRDPETHVKYRAKIDDMIQLGHAFEVTDQMKPPEEGRVWYIPHHSTGGKFRVVFDCAAACGGTSLNKQLLQGPDNTNTLLGVLFRFRPHSVALVADIRNMFHQVNVDPIDQTALRFLWWGDGDPSKSTKIYQLTVHTFGLTSSPSVSGYALRRTAQENRTNASEKAKTAISRHLYVDDLLISVPDSKAAVCLLAELNDLLASGGFQLAKYVSNRREVLEAVPPDLLAPQLHQVDLHEDDLPSHKALGLVWNPDDDLLCIKVTGSSHPFTRRGLLSLMASIYDPLGMVGPYMLPAKLILQRLTIQGLDWDSEISESDRLEWERWLNALPCLDQISMPRAYENLPDADRIELHCFADASCNGYGAVCYFWVSKAARVSTSFIIGKSRVVPIKKLSVPRLELCAAVVAIRLAKTVMREHDITIDQVTYWSDSTTVLAYLRDTSKRRPAFETNRISLIRKLSAAEQWRWVDTQRNPADLYSRGVSPKQVRKAEKWLHAPSFLLQDKSTWPKAKPEVLNGDDETNPTAAATVDHPSGCFDQGGICCTRFTIGDEEQDPLWRLTNCYSTLRTAVKSVAWLLRMKTFWHHRAIRVGWSFPMNPVGGKEFDDALLSLIRLSQQQALPDLLDTLQRVPWYEVMAGTHGDSAKASLLPLLRFCPIVQDGVIRIGGRLQRSSYPTDFKHPIVLPKRHHVTGLVIMDAHCNSGHNGSQYVLNKLCGRFHVIGQGRTVKHYIKQNCMVCRNQDASFGTQLMAPLPPARVESGKPVFENCGIDYMEPLEVKQGRSHLSRYCCVFTCLASRATHLELIYSLTTDSFLLGLRRFLSSRGHSTRVIYSDNATNFVGCPCRTQAWIAASR